MYYDAQRQLIIIVHWVYVSATIHADGSLGMKMKVAVDLHTLGGHKATIGRSLKGSAEALRLDFWRPGDSRDEVEQEMSIGYAGIFERMTLGSEVLEALRRPQLTASRPIDGLAMLKLEWADLIEPADVPGSRLVPLTKLLQAAAAGERYDLILGTKTNGPPWRYAGAPRSRGT